MAGVLIYKSGLRYYSFIAVDDSMYNAQRSGILDSAVPILWEKSNVTLQQIEDARKTKDTLVAKLNEGKEVDLAKELDGFFE